jgi:hypothetical protein
LKGVIAHNVKAKSIRIVMPKLLWEYLILPAKSGLYGFASFFTILIITKLIIYLMGYLDLFIVEIEDVIISFLGFGILFLFRFVQNIKKALEL